MNKELRLTNTLEMSDGFNGFNGKQQQQQTGRESDNLKESILKIILIIYLIAICLLILNLNRFFGTASIYPNQENAPVNYVYRDDNFEQIQFEKSWMRNIHRTQLWPDK